MIAGGQKYLETSRGSVQYLDVGTGTPTLYFHGTGAGNDAVLLLEQSLLKSNCRLIIPNRPGYHGTTLGHAGSAKSCADLAADLLEHLKLPRAVVIGTSGGGPSAACFARYYPHRTAALVLQWRSHTDGAKASGCPKVWNTRYSSSVIGSSRPCSDGKTRGTPRRAIDNQSLVFGA